MPLWTCIKDGLGRDASKSLSALSSFNDSISMVSWRGPVTLRCRCWCCCCLSCCCFCCCCRDLLNHLCFFTDLLSQEVSSDLQQTFSAYNHLWTSPVLSVSRTSSAALVAARHALRRFFAVRKLGPLLMRIHHALRHHTVRLLGTSYLSSSWLVVSSSQSRSDGVRHFTDPFSLSLSRSLGALHFSPPRLSPRRSEAFPLRTRSRRITSCQRLQRS